MEASETGSLLKIKSKWRIDTTRKYYEIPQNTLKIQNICAILLIAIQGIGELMLWIIIWKIGLELKQQCVYTLIIKSKEVVI